MEARNDSDENLLPPNVTRNRSIAAMVIEFDISEKTARNWIARGCPHSRIGAGRQIVVDFAEVAAWKRANNITGEPGRPKSESTGDGLEAARERKENALADWHEIRVKREQASLLPADEVQERWMKHVSAAKQVLIGMGAAIAPQLEGMTTAERQALIDTHVRDALTRLSEGNDIDMGEPASGDDGRMASPGADVAERVGVPVSDSTAGY